MFAERFVPGREITVGVLQRNCCARGPAHPRVGAEERVLRLRGQVHRGHDGVHPARPAGAESVCRGRAGGGGGIQAIGCRGYARVDMMVDEAGVPWFVEVNTLPGMTDTSDLPAQARAAGISYEDLVETILLTAVA